MRYVEQKQGNRDDGIKQFIYNPAYVSIWVDGY